jgi:hypothetical protein
LDGWFVSRGSLEHLGVDNGLGLMANAVREWIEEQECRTIYIEPRSPWENPYIESSDCRLREELLNRKVLVSGRHAQEAVEECRAAIEPTMCLSPGLPWSWLHKSIGRQPLS